MKTIVLVILIMASALAQEKSLIRGTSTRGATTKGIPVTVFKGESTAWQVLKEEGISKFEQDRRAILAMAGEFRASFEFLETFVIGGAKKLDTPYFSWGTEFVDVVEDKGDYISLQHILVMSFIDPKTGVPQGPYVTKHWRQDWQWEADQRLDFQGKNHWLSTSLSKKQSSNKWKWSVYQVDDSPRYSSLGEWTHLKDASLFDTEQFARPLPRREFSVRSDYELLLAKDSLVITADSWFHEQRNFKHVGKVKGTDFSKGSLLAREVGHNSYDRLLAFDFGAGKDYWQKSYAYWADVRAVWSEIIDSSSDFELESSYQGRPMYMYHFENAEDESILNLSQSERKQLVRDLINNFRVK